MDRLIWTILTFFAFVSFLVEGTLIATKAWKPTRFHASVNALMIALILLLTLLQG